METGTVCTVRMDRGFGFVRSGGTDYFFHCKDLVAGLEFDEQLLERAVQFNITTTPKGFRAVEVRAAE